MSEFAADLIHHLRQAQSMVVLTGSGISAPSGIPTYRSAAVDARWTAYDPDKVATLAGFERDPFGVFQVYQTMKRQCEAAQPNAGHYAVAQLEQLMPEFKLFTQNIDSLHQRAGSSNVFEVHGSLARTICARERRLVEDWDAEQPICPTCGAPLRPDIVWFGELLDAAMLQAAKDAFDRSDVALVIGTSAIVEPIASLPHRALRRKKTVIEINPDMPLRGIASYSLAGSADVVLPRLIEAVWI
ncbi:SIR2 family NAD-dependent protein deacylase [Herpetosiphon giganteus]|uniref:SIR2 family NAD-dependent protein deacylase n=1 Tax=Herpetosiphon giganteus TaxID=2029754 RepID=UPI00195AE877|nr:Sir2 family NAD-dependent protein deacetylase [Herpetosiphon giganteus]MBM7843686.1 NAD-dependent deacetylase [Herpetosiphon giganteus]